MLNKGKLVQDLEKVFKDQMGSPADAARAMATAYGNYCKQAMAGGAPAAFLGGEAKKIEALLVPAMSAQTGNPATFAAAWGNGLNAFWMAPPILFTAPPIVGMVTVVPGVAAAIPAITAAVTNIQNTEATMAQLLGTALDAATKTVLVTFTAPPPPAGPPPPAPVM